MTKSLKTMCRNDGEIHQSVIMTDIHWGVPLPPGLTLDSL